MKQRKSDKYKVLSDDRYDRAQYDEIKTDNNEDEDGVPWKGILFAIVLVIIGFFFIVKSYQMSYQDNFEYGRFFSLFIVGWLAFIPGIYHLWIATRAFQHVMGYSFDDIPNFD